MGRRGVVFLWRERRTTSATLLGSISAKLPTNTCLGGGSRIWFHIPEKFPLRDRICRKTLFLGYPICDQATGHGKRSATPTLFPSPSGHPADVPFLGDFCWRMYRFPPIHLRKCPYQQWAYLDGSRSRAARHLATGGTLLNRHIIFSNITRQVAPPSWIADMQWHNNPLHIC